MNFEQVTQQMKGKSIDEMKSLLTDSIIVIKIIESGLI